MEANTTTTDLALVMPQIFKDVDFAGLNGAIQKMADNNKKLDAEEKKVAVAVIDDWQKNVVRRLQTRASEMNQFIQFFDANYRGYYYGYASNDVVDEDVQEGLARQTGTLEEYHAYTTALENLRVHEHNRPEEPTKGLDSTVRENLTQNRDYQLAIHIYDLQTSNLRAQVTKKQKEWKVLLLQNESIQNALKKARSFNKNLNKLIRDCEDKTQTAKLCVSITDKGTRDAIKELLSFTETI